MQPTMNLRFIKRYEGTQLRFILQQQWMMPDVLIPVAAGVNNAGRTVFNYENKSEWRDVPLVEVK